MLESNVGMVELIKMPGHIVHLSGCEVCCKGAVVVGGALQWEGVDDLEGGVPR